MVINLCTPGHLDYADSYGLITVQLIRHLAALGVQTNTLALGNPDHPNCPADVARLAHRPFRTAEGSIFFGYPTNIDKFPQHTRRGKRIIVTMFESSRIPSWWVPLLNQLDAVIVPSQFCADVFRDCGVTVPIHTIPLGIGDTYQPFKRPLSKQLTFLAFLDRGERKGGLAAQHAFMLAFGEDTDYHLILKMRKPKIVINLTNQNQTMIQKDMSEQEMYKLYCSCDCLIAPARGEGFGLLPREFAATGGVSLATNWSGTADNLDEWGWPLPYKLVPAKWEGNSKLEGQDLGEWAEPDIEGMATMLTKVAAQREFYCAYAHEQAEHVRSMYSWPKFAEGVLNVWEGVADGAH